jgi:Sulfotransferase domain
VEQQAIMSRRVEAEARADVETSPQPQGWRPAQGSEPIVVADGHGRADPTAAGGATRLFSRPLLPGNEALIFLHLYKTGGTTLNRIIEWEYKLHRICSLEPNGWQWHYQRIIRWPARRLARVAVFKGHMPFGLHRVLPGPAKYVTILRDPVERAVSDYYFARGFSPHAYHRAALELDLEDYFLQRHEHNLQSRILAGPNSDDHLPRECSLISSYTRLRGSYLPYSQDPASSACDSAVLARAKENLARHFAVVGLTERYDETLALLKVLFGWKVKRYMGFRATPNRLPRGRIPASTVALIQEQERFDVALYEYARTLFEQAITTYTEEVEAALAAIRAAKKMTDLERRYYFISSVARAVMSRLYSCV